MNPIWARVILLGTVCLMGGLLLLLPNLTRRGLLFAVPVPDGFRNQPQALGAIRKFRLMVGAILVMGLMATGLASQPWLGRIHLGSVVLLMLAGTLAHYWGYRQVSAFAIQPTVPAEVELSSEPDQLPAWFWLSFLPPVLILLAAWYVNANWARLPERFPIHYGLDGKANGWMGRSSWAVYGLLGTAALGWMALCIRAVGLWLGARRGRARRLMLRGLVYVQYQWVGIFLGVSLAPLIGLPVWAMVATALIPMVPIALTYRQLAKAADSIEPTPNQCWRAAGRLYYNPDDPAVFVERRVGSRFINFPGSSPWDGVGYTYNLANSWALVMLIVQGVLWLSALLVWFYYMGR